MLKNFFAVFLAGSLLAGCNALYSPALHLPERPLAKNDGQATLGYGALNDVTGYDEMISFTDGNDLLVRYGFSDHVSLSVKWWSSTSLFRRGYYNGGFSASGVYAFDDRNKPFVFAVIPAWNLLFTNAKIIAMGWSLQAASWLPHIWKVRPYVASGPGYIAQSFRNKEWGYGLITNTGLVYDLDKNFKVNGEVSTVWGYRVSTKVMFTSIAPSISFSWNFHNQ